MLPCVQSIAHWKTRQSVGVESGSAGEPAPLSPAPSPRRRRTRFTCVRVHGLVSTLGTIYQGHGPRLASLVPGVACSKQSLPRRTDGRRSSVTIKRKSSNHLLHPPGTQGASARLFCIICILPPGPHHGGVRFFFCVMLIHFPGCSRLLFL